MTPDNLPPPDLEDHEVELWGQNVRADYYRADTVRRLMDGARAPLKARILELEAVHEDASGQILEERERWKPGHDRYEIVRRLNPRQFADLWQRHVHGAGQFDQLVDAISVEVRS